MRFPPSLSHLVWAFSFVLFATLSATADEDIRIFRLVNADAEAMTNLIDQLSDGGLKLATDARTNSIVMVGDEEQAKVIEALLMKLDQKVEDRDDDEEEEEEHEEREWEEREWAEHEEAEHRERQMMEERERRHHAENLGHEIRRLEMKMEMTKAEVEHQAKMMEFELEAAQLMTKTAAAKLEEITRKDSKTGLGSAHMEYRLRELDVKRKTLELEFFKSQAPMKLRELDFELGMRHREMDALGEHDRDHRREHDRDHGRDHDEEREREHEEERERERDRDERRERDQAANDASSRDIADSQVTATPMFSGPQVGEKITPFEAKLVLGKGAGETVQVFAEEEKAPQLLVFVHQVTRPAIGLSRMLIDYAKKLEPKGLQSNVVFLSDDRTETEAWMKRAQHALPKGVRTLVSVDGIEGPGAYGLNRKAQVTILVCDEGKVSANFALGQPSINVDAPKIGHALVQAIGGDEKPTLEDMGFAGRGMRRRMNAASNPEQDAKYRSMMAPLIQKNASLAEVMEAAANIETYAKEHAWFKQRVEKAAGLIVNGGKLSNYGTPEAQGYLKEWAK